jgi:hypothetical protein
MEDKIKLREILKSLQQELRSHVKRNALKPTKRTKLLRQKVDKTSAKPLNLTTNAQRMSTTLKFARPYIGHVLQILQSGPLPSYLFYEQLRGFDMNMSRIVNLMEDAGVVKHYYLVGSKRYAPRSMHKLS